MSLMLIITCGLLFVLGIACLWLADPIGNLIEKIIKFITYKGEDKNE